MEIGQLRYFYEAARLEHITKAAESLHVAQPALTKAIKNLEDELGVKLFYKSGRCVKLTEYGKFLKERAEHILRELDNLPQTVEMLEDVQDKTVWINVLAASTFVTDVIIKFKKIYPEVIFKMTQKENEIGADVSVLTNPVRFSGHIRARKSGVVEERVYVAVPVDSELAKNEEVDLADLRFSQFITLSGSRRFRPLCDAYCEYAGFKPQVVFESDSLIAVKNLIAAGVGVAFWPEFTWGKPDKRHIKLLRVKNPDCQREIFVLLSADKNSNMTETFFDFLLKELKKR